MSDDKKDQNDDIEDINPNLDEILLKISISNKELKSSPERLAKRVLLARKANEEFEAEEQINFPKTDAEQDAQRLAFRVSDHYAMFSYDKIALKKLTEAETESKLSFRRPDIIKSEYKTGSTGAFARKFAYAAVFLILIGSAYFLFWRESPTAGKQGTSALQENKTFSQANPMIARDTIKIITILPKEKGLGYTASTIQADSLEIEDRIKIINDFLVRNKITLVRDDKNNFSTGWMAVDPLEQGSQFKSRIQINIKRNDTSKIFLTSEKVPLSNIDSAMKLQRIEGLKKILEELDKKVK